GPCSVSPSAEVCNGTDDDCDDSIDEGLSMRRCWVDADADGYAAAGAVAMMACGGCPAGHGSIDPATVADCDDTRSGSYPGAVETCDGRDDDCNGTDPADEDSDGDRHTAITFTGCIGGFPKDDCHDGIVQVVPGQTAYFSTSYCPSGGAAGLCVPPSCRDAAGGCTWTRTFDYDCDGSITVMPRATGCSGTACTCSDAEGPWLPAERIESNCGLSVSWATCACVSSSCGWEYGTSPLRCR
ncbi:MAG: regulator of chromosome condensation, partial [Acidimicrobiaceae bacterium]